MIVKAYKVRVLNPPRDDLLSVIDETIDHLEERSIMVVASKVVSIWQGRCIPVGALNKDELIKKEADFYLPRDFTPHGWVMHTLKDGLFIATAGIDLSNGKNFYILWPRNPMEAAEKIRNHLIAKFKVKNLGVLIVDSHSVPLHRGLVGLSLGFAGFLPLRDYRGMKDLFGKTLEVSMTNVADSLASAASVVMGEGAEQTPLCIISEIPFIEFVNKYKEPKDPYLSFKVPMKEDLFGPFFDQAPWKKGRK